MQIIELRKREYNLILTEEEYRAFQHDCDIPVGWCSAEVATLLNYILSNYYNLCSWRYSF